ncbi:hypothetical protein N665_0684s0001, partial [Sinapis alba]
MVVNVGLLEICITFIFFLFFIVFLFHKKTPKHLLTNWPVFGMLPGLLLSFNRFYDAVTELLEASNMTFGFKGPWLSGIHILLTVDPANIRHILSSNFDN